MATVGCGDDAESGRRACVDVMADGVDTDTMLAELDANGCTDADGEWIVVGWAFLPCDDGRNLYFGDYGRGVIDGGTFSPVPFPSSYTTDDVDQACAELG